MRSGTPQITELASVHYAIIITEPPAKSDLQAGLQYPTLQIIIPCFPKRIGDIAAFWDKSHAIFGKMP